MHGRVLLECKVGLHIINFDNKYANAVENCVEKFLEKDFKQHN